jgi:hypothetical protein
MRRNGQFKFYGSHSCSHTVLSQDATFHVQKRRMPSGNAETKRGKHMKVKDVQNDGMYPNFWNLTARAGEDAEY